MESRPVTYPPGFGMGMESVDDTHLNTNDHMDDGDSRSLSSNDDDEDDDSDEDDEVDGVDRSDQNDTSQ